MATDLRQDRLAEARAAFARHAWVEAFDLFARIDGERTLDAEDLEAMGEAAWWTGHHDACISANERAFAAYLDAGKPRPAAIVALTLMVNHLEAGAPSVGGAWLKRAIRLLENEPDCTEKGHLELRLAIRAHGKGNLDEALEHERRALDLGTRFGDHDLQALTLAWQGKALLLKGEVDEGMSLMEEATAAAVGGELSPRATGAVYCMMIATCQQLADYTRAGEWTEAARRWCERQAISGFPGVCRVHRAEIMRLRGSWQEAEQEARRAHEELRDFDVEVAGDALYEIGEIRLRMGDLAGAEEIFRQALELGHSGQPGLALLALERGDAKTAASLIKGVLDNEWHVLWRGHLLPVQVEVAVAGGDLDTARAAVGEIEKIAEDFGSDALHARAAQSRGLLQLAESDAAAACRSFTKAWSLWNGIDAPFDAARARRLMAEAQLSKGEVATGLLELRAAKAAFDKLGALPESDRCQRVLAAHAGAAAADARRAMVTFMFTDIVGSTNLLEAIGDESWRELRQWHDQTLRGLFTEHGGREVDHAGDGFFVSFEDPSAALRCAVAIQRKLADHRRAAGFAPQVRIGIHAGEALAVDRDYTGRTVHQAARIGAIGDGGEIVVSAETAEAAGSEFALRHPREVMLKGISKPVRVASVDWS